MGLLDRREAVPVSGVTVHRLMVAAALGFALPAAAATDAPLRIISIDVEGGAATLYVTPQGHSLLIDTGWPAGIGGPRPAPGAPPAPPVPTPSSAERIVAAAKAAGLSRIDYVLVTHYHVDHVGGAVELAGLIPVGTFVDHGPNREDLPPNAQPRQIAMATATLYPQYLAAIGASKHVVMIPGQQLRIDAMVVTAVDSDRAIPARPLSDAGASGAGTGAPGTGCATATTNTNLGGEENPRSLGVLIGWGKARILSLGDTTWDVENSLVCPRDLIGPVDLMFADNHGTANANSPVLINTVRPTVFVIGNGPTKGADAATFDTVMASPRIKGAWQLHTATRSPESNPPADQIANPAGMPDAINPLQMTVARNGAVTVRNPRNGFTITYAPGRP